MMPLRISEWILVGYFAWVMAATFLLPLTPRRRALLLVVNSALLAALFLIPMAESVASPLLLSMLRDWLPVPLLLVAYHEAGFLISQRRNHTLEKTLLAFDDALRRNSTSMTDSRFRWLWEFLEFSYLLCYPLVPLAIASLYIAQMGHLADPFWTAVLPAVLFCYALSPLLPSLPPRSLRPATNPPDGGLFFRKVNLWVLARGSIHSNIFPSAHVAGAVATALMLLKFVPSAGAVAFLIAAGIAWGSVHGRYHYAADSILGAGVGMAGFALALHLFP